MSYSCDEYYAVYNERRVIARKAFECECVPCSAKVRVGDTYTKVSIVYDGRAETVRRCMRCQHLHEHLRELGDGETWPDERLNCGLEYEDEWGDLPAEIAALAFWQPGEPLPAVNPCTLISYHQAAWSRGYAPACHSSYRFQSAARPCVGGVL